MFGREMGAHRVAPLGAFARATQSYWLGVFPGICKELRGWRERAGKIADPLLRELALDALSKRGNMEGAAAFATFLPRARRGGVVRATVAFQAAYNYLDLLSEQPSHRPVENSRRLHQALLVALDPSVPHSDYYELHQCRDDGGYLAALIDACRDALGELPSYEAVAPAARRAAERVIGFQAFQCSEPHTIDAAPDPMEAWARGQTPQGADLRWWETAGSCGSSLGVHVMIATAAEAGVQAAEVEALEHSYFPWIGALHTMLDHLIDTAEDAAGDQRNLIGCYDSLGEAAERMKLLAERSLRSAEELSPGARHMLIVSAMASFYLSAPEASSAAARPISQAVLDAFGPLARPALAVFSARHTIQRALVGRAWRSTHDLPELRHADRLG
jgi:tetraprenyl-beta-curcumene synthase